MSITFNDSQKDDLTHQVELTETSANGLLAAAEELQDSVNTARSLADDLQLSVNGVRDIANQLLGDVASIKTTLAAGTVTTPTPPVVTPPTSGGNVPVPGPKDRIILDTRQTLPTATTFAQAWPAAKLGSAKLGTKNMYELNRPDAFTVAPNFDGTGISALRVNWKAWGGVKADQAAKLLTYFGAPYPRHLIFAWKQRLGRTPSDSAGVGTPNTFQVCNPAAEYNAACKRLLIPRDQPNMGDLNRLDYDWAGPAPGTPVVDNNSANLRIPPSTPWNPQEHVGTVITQVLEVQAESAPGAGDGIVRVWINGVQVINRTGVAGLGAEAFERFQFPDTFNSPAIDQTEYFLEFVVWEPAP